MKVRKEAGEGEEEGERRFLTHSILLREREETPVTSARCFWRLLRTAGDPSRLATLEAKLAPLLRMKPITYVCNYAREPCKICWERQTIVR